MKKLASPILAALLLSSLAPLPSAVPLAPTAAHAAAQPDTIREYTRPAKTANSEYNDRSVEAPVSWLIVEDHRLEACNAAGKCVTYSSHPILRINGEGRTALAHSLDTWSKQEAQDAKRASILPMNAKKATLNATFSKRPLTSTTPSSRSGDASMST